MRSKHTWCQSVEYRISISSQSYSCCWYSLKYQFIDLHRTAEQQQLADQGRDINGWKWMGWKIYICVSLS